MAEALGYYDDDFNNEDDEVDDDAGDDDVASLSDFSETSPVAMTSPVAVEFNLTPAEEASNRQHLLQVQRPDGAGTNIHTGAEGADASAQGGHVSDAVGAEEAVDNSAVVRLLQSCGLTDRVLSRLWRLAATGSKSGRLDGHGFFVALKLVSLVRAETRDFCFFAETRVLLPC
jgi:hypothetical protein